MNATGWKQGPAPHLEYTGMPTPTHCFDLMNQQAQKPMLALYRGARGFLNPLAYHSPTFHSPRLPYQFYFPLHSHGDSDFPIWPASATGPVLALCLSPGSPDQCLANQPRGCTPSSSPLPPLLSKFKPYPSDFPLLLQPALTSLNFSNINSIYHTI